MVGDKKHRFSPGHSGPPEDFEEHLRYTFDRLYKEGATHPKMMSIAAVAKFIGYAKSHPDVWFARRIEIARHWQENHA